MKNILDILRNDGVILHLTDTTWGLAVDSFSKKAIDKIYKIKERPSSKSFILLVSSIEMLVQYVNIENPDVIKIINDPRPTTIIYSKTKNLPEYLLAKDKSIAIRVVKKPDLIKLIEGLKHPLVSTSANISGSEPPIYFDDINKDIVDNVDLVLKEEIKTIVPPSRIIKFDGNSIIVIRD